MKSSLTLLLFFILGISAQVQGFFFLSFSLVVLFFFGIFLYIVSFSVSIQGHFGWKKVDGALPRGLVGHAAAVSTENGRAPRSSFYPAPFISLSLPLSSRPPLGYGRWQFNTRIQRCVQLHQPQQMYFLFHFFSLLSVVTP
jgi:hypothetical protein